jgi:hypothetical protein
MKLFSSKASVFGKLAHNAYRQGDIGIMRGGILTPFG